LLDLGWEELSNHRLQHRSLLEIISERNWGNKALSLDVDHVSWIALLLFVDVSPL
jgi:hypothetical protein